MSDVGSDLTAVEEMVYEAQDRLFQNNPNNELVSFMLIRSNTERQQEWEKVIGKFNKSNPPLPPRGAMECASAMCLYLVALKKELGEYVVPKEPEKVVVASLSDDDDDEPLPF